MSIESQRSRPSVSRWLSPRLDSEYRSIALRLLILLVFGAGASWINPNFATLYNGLSILRQASLLFFLASGATLVLIAGGIDLSVGATLSLSAALCAAVLHTTGSTTLGVLSALGAGLAVGLINGILVSLLRLQPFLATYGTLWIVSGIALWFMGGVPITGFSPEFRFVGSGFWWGIPAPVWLMGGVIAVGSFVLARTTYGQHLTMMGSNQEAATLSGVPVSRNLLMAYALSGLGAGIAAIVLLGRANSADPGMGDSYLLPSITAILVGGASLFGGVGTLIGTALGAILLTLLLNMMNMMLISSVWQPFVTGGVLILVALASALWRLRPA